jgi:hypothetical protein
MDRATPLPDYDAVLGPRREALSGAHAFTQPGDPSGAAQALMTVLASDQPPLRLLLGAMAADAAPQVYRARLKEFSAWDGIARSADSAETRSPRGRGVTTTRLA